MRRLFMSVLFLLTGSAAVMGQDAAPRDVTISISDRKGKPVSNAVVHTLSSREIGITNKDGIYILPALTDRDTLNVNIPRVGQILIPVNGLKKIELTVKSRREIEARDLENEDDIDVVYGTVRRKTNTQPVSSINVDDLLKETGATTLSQLLTGQIAGVDAVTGFDGSGYITISPNQGPALIVVDGIAFDSFQDVENRFNVNRFSTLTILKNGAGYGVRGGNGVVVLTTKR